MSPPTIRRRQADRPQPNEPGHSLGDQGAEPGLSGGACLDNTPKLSCSSLPGLLLLARI
eukprot:CAMPEP_0195122634 /NCGR_PEP_ID=MMETSP0448-20130528/126862_1 /TAXON_ID=66468 /ORGANISM="Heterocapsa triquestra, Strain CCMP 448" /LENGTH=58 /DNA_ID=CAMNT_0040160137 /DNA_START=12 /DNA_END=185 /DNA_ORIENTATION=-